MNSTDAVLTYRRSGEQGDPAALADVLHPDVVLTSPLSDRAHFTGHAEVLAVLTAGIGAFTDLRYREELGDGDRRVLVASGKVDGVAFDETTLLELADDGRISGITLFIRPLPAATTLMRAIGGRLLAAEGKPAGARAVRAALTPLVGLSRAADRIAAAVAG